MAKTFNDMVDIRYPKELYFAGIRLQQSWTTLFLLEDILDKEKDITRVVELGTGQGALALFFGLHMYERGQVLTIDNEPKMSMKWYGLAKNYRIAFVQADIMDPSVDRPIRDFLGHSRSLIFCDAGDKDIRRPQVLKYAEFLSPGSLLLVHDFGNSLLPEDIEPLLDLTQWSVPIFRYYRQSDFDYFETFILSLIKT